MLTATVMCFVFLVYLFSVLIIVVVIGFCLHTVEISLKFFVLFLPYALFVPNFSCMSIQCNTILKLLIDALYEISFLSLAMNDHYTAICDHFLPRYVFVQLIDFCYWMML